MEGWPRAYVVLHFSGFDISHHLHFEVGLFEQILEFVAVAVAIAGAFAEGDGCAEREDAQRGPFARCVLCMGCISMVSQILMMLIMVLSEIREQTFIGDGSVGGGVLGGASSSRRSDVCADRSDL